MSANTALMLIEALTGFADPVWAARVSRHVTQIHPSAFSQAQDNFVATRAILTDLR